jgi:hypothetical protein
MVVKSVKLDTVPLLIISSVSLALMLNTRILFVFEFSNTARDCWLGAHRCSCLFYRNFWLCIYRSVSILVSTKKFCQFRSIESQYDT